jgi:cytochrome c-type biogenesis protein CcmH
MTLMIVFAAMVLAVLAALLVPLLRRQAPLPPRINYDVAVYRDQLAEVERDIERGLLSPDQADAARTEIYRRTLAADSADAALPSAGGTRRSRLAAALTLLIVLPLGAGLIYAYLGSPALSAKPYAERKNDPDFIMEGQAKDLAKQLESKPDAAGYARLGDTYAMLRRYDLAVDAYQKALQMDAGNAKFWSQLGELISVSQDGMIIPEAREAFIKALRLDAHDARAEFYLGLAEDQIDQPKRAVSIWRDLEKNGEPDASWRPMVDKQIAAVSGKAGFDPESIAPAPPPLGASNAAPAGMGMNKADRVDTVHQMVDRLAAKLKANPDDLDGWRLLARSYQVLGETDKEKDAESHIEALQAKEKAK